MTDPLRDDQVQDYQDDLDTEGVDRITHEATDDPTEELQVPAEEFKKELDHQDGGGDNYDQAELDEENVRETIEGTGDDDRRESYE